MPSSHEPRFSFVAGSALYLVAYILLETASNIPPLDHVGLTGWHASVGLSILLPLIYGSRAIPLLVLAAFLAGILVEREFGRAALDAIIIGGGYALTAMALRQQAVRFAITLASLRDVFILMVAAIGGALAISVCYVTTLFLADFISAADFWFTVLRIWVSDMVGIATVTPFGLLAVTRRHFIKADWHAALQITIIVFALAIAIGSAEKERLELFFLLFLPITWIAVSSGLEGVSVALLVTQIGLIAALHFIPGSTIDVTPLQARMLVLAVTGLVAGALVAEAGRAEEKLRENQAAIARLSRLGSMGELAIAIAHEVNQPLSAAGTYSRLVTESLEVETLKDPSIVAIAKKATAQVERAADVIRRLRALVRLGRSELSPMSIDLLVRESLDLVRPILDYGTIVVQVEIDRDLPPVMVDRIQIEQVLLNLLRNSAEAIASAPGTDGRISLRATRSERQLAKITVSDGGPGFPKEIMDAAPALFMSSKADGLGVGLSLSRSIVEAHGGALQLETSEAGASVSFTLPFVEVSR